MNSQKEYWNKKISEWSFASYGKNKKVSLIEKIATYFRAVDSRKEVALKLVGPRITNKTIIDMGCGLGEFSFGLIMRYKPKKIIAYDISEIAIKELKRASRDLKLKHKLVFQVGDVSELTALPEFDIAVGLGFIDYLKPDQLKHLFTLLGNKPFLFSFFEKKISLFNFMHKIYLALQNCPGAYKYTRNQIRSFVPDKGKINFIKRDNLQFITNYKKF